MEMEQFKDQMSNMQRDIAYIREDAKNAHQRIDKISEVIGEMREDVAKVAGCVEPLCRNVESISSALVGKGLGGNEVTMKIIDAVKWLIVASIVIGGMSVIGYYGMQASAKHGESEVKVQR